MTRPLRPCGQPGCSALVRAGYCERHEQTAYRSATNQRRRADAAKGADRGYYASPAHRRWRTLVLGLHPRCACGAPATVADHVIPRKERPDLALVVGNGIGRCASCHNAKTARQDGGFGNPRGVA